MKYSSHFLQQVLDSQFVKQLEQGVLTIDNSEYCTWDSCMAKGTYSGALRRMNAMRRSALSFGSAIHAGIEPFLKRYGDMDFVELVGEGLKAAHADAALNHLDKLGDPKRNTTKMEDLLQSYFLEYSRVPSMRFNIVSLSGELAVEKSFVVPLGVITIDTPHWGKKQIEVMWAGKIDVIELFEGAVGVVDHKTTTVMGEKFVDDKVRSSQMPGYTFAIRSMSELFPTKNIFGVRINALAMRAAGYEFRQFAIPFPEWKIAEWQEETLASIGDLIHQLSRFLETGLISPTREHCVTKYGKCPYFDVCDAHPTMRDRMLFDDNYFYISDWSPLNE